MRLFLLVNAVLISTRIFAADGQGQMVVVVDSGIANAAIGKYIPSSRLKRENCYSISGENYNRMLNNTGAFIYDFIETASTCPNGNSRQSGSGSARVPRRIRNGYVVSRNVKSDLYAGGKRHGTNVAWTVLKHAKNVDLYSINSAHYYDGRLFDLINKPPSGKERKCKDPNGGYCTTHNTDRMQTVLNHLLSSTENIAVINLSLGAPAANRTLCNDKVMNGLVRQLKEKGIAVVSSSGNDGDKSRIGWPACLPEVISVGAINVRDQLLPSSNSSSDLDFVALGALIGWDGEYAQGTSFAAPIVSAAYAAMREANPNVNVDQMTEALKNASGIKIVGDKVDQAIINRAVQAIKNVSPKPLDPADPSDPSEPGDPINLRPNQVDTNRYGNNYGSNRHKVEVTIPVVINIASAQLQSAKSDLDSSHVSATSVEKIGKYRLVFDAYDIDSNGELSVYINGRLLQNLKANGNNRQTKYVINNIGPEQLNIGTNRIRFRQRHNNETWGVTNISLEEVPASVITLTPGRINSGSYGYGFGASEHLTELQIRFTRTGYDMAFTLEGWDIDVADESAIYLNGRRLGYQRTGPSSGYNGGSRFTFRNSRMVNGTNTILIKQKTPGGSFSGFEDEKWGVRNLLLSPLRSNLTTSLNKTGAPKADVPFTATATVRNTGAGASSNGVLRFYLSPDSNITTADTQLASQNIGGILENRHITINRTLRLNAAQIKQYIGVCVTGVTGETTTADNCSRGISAKAVNIAPIIMLLLDDED